MYRNRWSLPGRYARVASQSAGSVFEPDAVGTLTLERPGGVKYCHMGIGCAASVRGTRLPVRVRRELLELIQFLPTKPGPNQSRRDTPGMGSINVRIA